MKQQSGEELTAEELAQVSGGAPWVEGPWKPIMSWLAPAHYNPHAVATGSFFTAAYWSNAPKDGVTKIAEAFKKW
jgi:bacteriocin-like protein